MSDVSKVTRSDAAAKPDDDTKIALRGSEERLRFALRGAGAGMWDWDVKSGRATWDKAYYELYGLPTSVKPCFENWLESIHLDDRAIAQRAVQEVFEKRSTDFRVEYRIRHSVKGERWLAGMGHATYAQDGSPMRLTGVNVDITERKLAEAALLASEERLRFALRGARAGMWDWNVVANTQVWNEQQYDLHGIARTDPPSHAGWMASIHADDRTAVQRAVEETFALRHADYRVEYRVPLAAQGVRWIESSGTVIYADDGKPLRMVGVTQDVTERHRAQLEAAELGRQRQYALSAAKMGWWHLDPLSGVVTWDDRFREIFGVAEAPLHVEEIFKRMHPDDLPGVRVAVAAALNPADPKPYLIEYRLNNPSGTMRWVEANGTAHFSGEGEGCHAVSFVGTVLDITERKQMEAALRTSERHFHTLAEVSPVGIFRADTCGQTTYVNRRLCEIVGLTSAAAMGSGWMHAVHPEDRDALTREWEEAARAGRESRIEYRFLRADGLVAWVLGQAVPERDHTGALTGYVGTVADITVRKQAEADLRHSRDELEQRVWERTAELQASEERFQQVVSAIDQVFWLSSADKKEMLYISPGYERIWERTCRSLIASPHTWLDAIHPEDRARILEAATMKQVNGTYDEEYRIIRPDGTERWIRDRAFPIRDATGKVTRMAGVADDITARKKLQREMVSATEREQQRIGQDLHDGIGQMLTGAKFKTALLGQKLDSAAVRPDAGDAYAIEAILDQAIGHARGLAQGLNPLKDSPIGLMEALEHLAANLDTEAGPRCRCHIPQPVSIFEREDASHLYRIAQEAVQNALKHAGAKSITIQLTRHADIVTLAVNDDGTGLAGPASNHGGNGLSNMRVRAAMIRGKLEINTGPNGGTTVMCRIQRPGTATERQP